MKISIGVLALRGVIGLMTGQTEPSASATLADATEQGDMPETGDSTDERETVTLEGEVIEVAPSCVFDPDELEQFQAATALDPAKLEAVVKAHGIGEADDTLAFAPFIVETEAPPHPSLLGHLDVRSDPITDVFEGVFYLGQTPLKVDLPPGPHRLTFVKRKGSLRFTKLYTVKAGEPQVDQLYFGTARVEIEAPEGARIYVNDRLLGVAPLPAQEIFEGEHRLRVAHGSSEITEKVTLLPGHTFNYKLALSNLEPRDEQRKP